MLWCLAFATLLTSVLAPAAAQAQGTQTKRLLLYTGTTGFRHTDGINGGRPVVQSALEAAGYTVDWEDCTNNGGGATNCDNSDKNPRNPKPETIRANLRHLEDMASLWVKVLPVKATDQNLLEKALYRPGHRPQVVETGTYLRSPGH